MIKVVVIGGTWDHAGGKPSSIIEEMVTHIEADRVAIWNGGHYNSLKKTVLELSEYDIIMWFANVPNDLEKIRDIKKLYPKKIVIHSKRNDDCKYSFQELVKRSLDLKANLTVEFSKGLCDSPFELGKPLFYGRVFDPLGAVWCDYTTDFKKLTKTLIERAKFLMSVTRQGTVQIKDNPLTMPNDKEFFDIVRRSADIFHELTHPAKGVTRFLGNSSFRFRCERGFPSFRFAEGSPVVYVSRRNVDKRAIGPDAFVPVYFDPNSDQKTIYYHGDNKPSVDTPIQLRLYDRLKWCNYMLHSHVYIKGAAFTKKAIPCGGIEEYDEIIECIMCSADIDMHGMPGTAVNLIGHGSIILAKEISFIKYIVDQGLYESRNVPEVM